MNGMPDGGFAPQAGATRAQAAKVAYLLCEMPVGQPYPPPPGGSDTPPDEDGADGTGDAAGGPPNTDEDGGVPNMADTAPQQEAPAPAGNDGGAEGETDQTPIH
jgi:hypothetical protein